MKARQVIFDLPPHLSPGRLLPVLVAVLGLAVAAAATNRPATSTVAQPAPVQSHNPELIFAVATSSNAPDATDAPAPAPAQNTVRMLVTAYCPCKKCCGPNAHGITASGRPVSYNNGQFIAADTTLLPFGSTVIIPGYAGGQPVPVIDRGSAIIGNHIDVFFPTHQEALNWGRRWITVTVVSH
jgi:3D (Asp-Asp-Asp) domain-containing protein